MYWRIMCNIAIVASRIVQIFKRETERERDTWRAESELPLYGAPAASTSLCSSTARSLLLFLPYETKRFRGEDKEGGRSRSAISPWIRQWLAGALVSRVSRCLGCSSCQPRIIQRLARAQCINRANGQARSAGRSAFAFPQRSSTWNFSLPDVPCDYKSTLDTLTCNIFRLHWLQCYHNCNFTMWLYIMQLYHVVCSGRNCIASIHCSRETLIR